MRHALLLLLASLLCSGCTGLLWQDTDWDCKPADNPNLQVFRAVQQKDWLVVYNEISERNHHVRTRAYLLYKNQNRVASGKRPHFTNLKKAHSLVPVPVFETTGTRTNFPMALYVITPTNTASFTIYSNQVPTASYDLPWYPDPVGQVERIAFSPIAITADIIIVGAVVYVIVLEEFQN